MSDLPYFIGEYSGEDCENCGRNRVMIGDDEKHRCEKCGWCKEDKDFDGELLDYLS